MPKKITDKVKYCVNDEHFDDIQMGSRPILPIKGTITIGTMLNFDAQWHNDVTCKQSLTWELLHKVYTPLHIDVFWFYVIFYTFYCFI